jgi:AraC-like DNA-binding protein
MKLHIKYMVSHRCKLAVRAELEKLGIVCKTVELGVAEILCDLDDDQKAHLREALQEIGLILLEDKTDILIESIKCAVVEMVHYSEENQHINFSAVLSEKLNLNYNYLSNLFSKNLGITIEQFIINHKIERAKELLIYDELSLTEISYRLNYSSVAHLSNQFKKNTGVTPSHYKALGGKSRIKLEEL